MDVYRQNICHLMIVFKGGVQYKDLIDTPLPELDFLFEQAAKFIDELSKGVNKNVR